MATYSLSHLSDLELDHDLSALVAKDRETTALLLAHLAEFRARKRYVPAGYASMRAYCVGELGLSEDAAHKRIQAAGVARQFPEVFAAVACGRLHLSGICLLAPRLTAENGAELLEAAAGKTKGEIEVLIARRFPQSETLPMSEAMRIPEKPEQSAGATVQERSGKTAPGQFSQDSSRSKVVPIATQRFSVRLTIGEATHDKLRYAQDLLGHQIPSGDLAAVIDRALDTLIGRLERRKFGATDRPRAPQPRTSGPPGTSLGT